MTMVCRKNCQPCFRKVKNIIEFRALSLATLSAQELLIGETRMKRVRGSQQVGESPSSSQQAKKTSLNRENIESVHSVRMCLFVEGDQHHDKNPPQFRPFAPKNITTAPRRLPEFLQGDKERHDATKIQVSESPADRSIQADIMRQSGLRKYQDFIQRGANMPGGENFGQIAQKASLQPFDEDQSRASQVASFIPKMNSG
ncbi:uncharacterized protein [Montipora capricornis]|uniref:uncharacterized protein isoform X2 n=1 Tax=Montipora capricornis TaxID=246305 RepID=UPI0035F14007